VTGWQTELGKDKVRFLYFRYGRWRWRTTPAMRSAGFAEIVLSKGEFVDGHNVPAALDIARAMELNKAWDRYRAGLPPEEARKYPAGSVGDGYERALHLRVEQRKQRGIEWGTEQHSRDDWPRAWKYIEPLFADCDPNTVTPEMLLMLRSDIAANVSAGEAYRVIKVWRAL
jgi:hypothetical protein